MVFLVQIKRVVLVLNSSSKKQVFFVFSISPFQSNEVSLFVLLLYQKHSNGNASLIFFKCLLNDENVGALMCPDSE